MVTFTKEDKEYLTFHFQECEKKGHKLFEWGGLTYCATCGFGSSYVIHIKDKLAQRKECNIQRENIKQ